MEAPPGEDKLAMLSEIAQEHGVEWDAHNAALEMLPSDTSMQNASPGYQQQLLDITGGGKWLCETILLKFCQTTGRRQFVLLL